MNGSHLCHISAAISLHFAAHADRCVSPNKFPTNKTYTQFKKIQHKKTMFAHDHNHTINETDKNRFALCIWEIFRHYAHYLNVDGLTGIAHVLHIQINSDFWLDGK